VNQPRRAATGEGGGFAFANRRGWATIESRVRWRDLFPRAGIAVAGLYPQRSGKFIGLFYKLTNNHLPYKTNQHRSRIVRLIQTGVAPPGSGGWHKKFLSQVKELVGSAVAGPWGSDIY